MVRFSFWECPIFCFYDFSMFRQICYVYMFFYVLISLYVSETLVSMNLQCYLCFRGFNMFKCGASKGFCVLIPNTWSDYLYKGH